MNKHILLNWLIEFGPIILFFISLKVFGEDSSGFVFATEIFTIATAIVLLFALIRDKRIALFPLVAGIFVIFFGALTVRFNQPEIFVFKDTIYNGSFFLFLFVGVVKGKGYLRMMFEPLFDITSEGWKRLSSRWMVMFLLLVVSNEIVWYLYPLNIWVEYKFLATITTAIFGLYQITLTKKYRMETASSWGLRL